MARIELSNTGGGGTTLSLTTTGTSGAATLAGSVLNIPIYQGQLTLTTTGTSGAATLVGTTLNIPQYSGGGGGGTPAGSAGEVQFNSTPAGSFAASSNLAWDNTNVRLNIGAPLTPTARLNVRGGGTLSGTSTQIWTNSGNTELMRLRDDGNLGISTSAPSSQLTIGAGSVNTEMLMEHRATNASTITFNTTSTNTFAGAFLGTGSSFAFGSFKANQCNLTGGAGGVAIRLANQSTSGFHIYAGNSNSNNSLLQFLLFPVTGNILTKNGGTFTDDGYRFDIISASSTHGLRVRAPNASGSTNALLIQNTTVSDLYKIEANGKISYLATNTAAGTTGPQTINRPSGTVNFAIGASALVVTNSLCTTSSIVFATVRTDDATAYIKNVVPAAGSFTINLDAAATAETSVGFFIIN